MHESCRHSERMRINVVLILLAILVVSCTDDAVDPSVLPVPVSVRITGGGPAFADITFDTAWSPPSGAFAKGALDDTNQQRLRTYLTRAAGIDLDPFYVVLYVDQRLAGNPLTVSIGAVRAFSTFDVNVRESIVRMRTF